MVDFSTSESFDIQQLLFLSHFEIIVNMLLLFQNSYGAESRRLSESNTSSPFKSNLKWSFGIRKSQSATDSVNHMTNESGEVEAKSISEGKPCFIFHCYKNIHIV